MHRSLSTLGILALLLGPAPVGASEVVGRVSLAVEGARLSDLGPTVVFLAREDGGLAAAAPRRHLEIRQRNARFEPDFLVVSAGQSVEMPNDDTIFHNVFSLSRPNDFDLGVYPAGQRRTVTFAHPGLVRIYCSIHESMSGAVLVTPTPWFATADAAGEYRIREVPPGRYRLTVWNQKLPSATRALTLSARGRVTTDVVLGAPTP